MIPRRKLLPEATTNLNPVPPHGRLRAFPPEHLLAPVAKQLPQDLVFALSDLRLAAALLLLLNVVLRDDHRNGPLAALVSPDVGLASVQALV